MNAEQHHSKYLWLAKEMMRFPEGSAEREALRNQKRLAWIAWQQAKDNPQPAVDPAPIAETPVAVEVAGPQTVIVTAKPLSDSEAQEIADAICPPAPPPSSSASTPPTPTPKKPGRWRKRRGTSA